MHAWAKWNQWDRTRDRSWWETMPTVTVAAVDSKYPARADFRCDGTDDDLVINAARSVLPASGGKVELLEGNYYVTDQIKLYSNQMLEGQGAGTVVQLPAGHDSKVSGLIYTDGYSAVQEHIAIQNLVVDGIDLALNTVGIQVLQTDYCRINNVAVRNCAGGSDYGILANLCIGLVITNSRIHDCVNNLIEIKQSPGGCFIGNQFQNGKCEFYCHGGSKRTTMQYFGNYFDNTLLTTTPVNGKIAALVFVNNVMKNLVRIWIRETEGLLLGGNQLDASAVDDASAPLVQIDDTVEDYRIIENLISTGHNGANAFGAVRANGVRGLVADNIFHIPYENNYGVAVTDPDASDLIVRTNTFVGESGRSANRGLKLTEGENVRAYDNKYIDLDTGNEIASAASGTVISGGIYEGVTTEIDNSDVTAVIRDVDDDGNETIMDGYGETVVRGSVTEEITLSTVALTTDSVANLLPADAVIESVTAYVTTTITNATNWSVGDATTAARFISAETTLVAGTSIVGLLHVDQTGAAGPKQDSAAKIRITCTGSQPDAGAVRITVQYRQHTGPTS